MRLDHLHIQNFRCYEDAHFDFQPGFNLVVGVNGSGKTSLLQAVAASFHQFSTMGKGSIPVTEQDVRFTIEKFDDRVRFERRYPLRLNAEGSVLGATHLALLKERADQQTPDIPIHLAVSEALKRLDAGEEVDLPMLAFYRGDRRWASIGVSAESAATKKASRLDGYIDWFNSAANLKEFEGWMIGKTLERLQRLSRSKSTTGTFNDELQWVNSALKFTLPDSEGIEYDLELRSLLVNIGGSRTLPFNDLSDGQRGLIALIADIARRMCILNPHMGKDVLKNTSGVIIIDELDIHLHPAWQRNIVNALKTAFPKVQFIAASHSPQIIGSLRPEEIIMLDDGDASHPRVSYGLESSRVLEEVMGVAQREPEIEHLLSELFSALENNDLEGAKTRLSVLKAKAPDLPEFARAEALLKRKEVLGK